MPDMRPGSGPQEHPVAGADQVRSQRVGQPEHAVAEPSEHDREADQEEADQSQAEDRQVGRDHVCRVLRPTESGLDHGEPGLHEDHQRRADDDPQHVEPHADVGGRGNQRAVDRPARPRPCAPATPGSTTTAVTSATPSASLAFRVRIIEVSSWSCTRPLTVSCHGPCLGPSPGRAQRRLGRSSGSSAVGVTARGPLLTPPTARRSCVEEERARRELAMRSESDPSGSGGPRRCTGL